MRLEKFNDCWKFEDSDMFCLDEDGKDLYFVFSAVETPVTDY